MNRPDLGSRFNAAGSPTTESDARRSDLPATSGDVAGEWARRLKLGQCSLEDALMMTLLARQPAHSYMIARVEAAFDAHREGGADLAESFGCARAGNEAQAIRSELVARQVFDLVKELNERFPKGSAEYLALSRSNARTRKGGHTAFSRAGEILKMPEATVIKHYSRGKSLLKRSNGG